ncbi:hypothetical protein EBU24_03050 [bacterium]|nr:hypothetical protein [bacterium]
MSLYKPDIKTYYGPIDDDHRLIPAPDLSIAINFNYTNDTIIGYTYNVTLTGVATALDLRSLDYGDEITDPNKYNIGAVTDHLNKLRKILSQNGNILQVVKGSDDSHILKARGGILRSFTFDESPNQWIHYANYTAVIEFQTIDLMDSTENCGEPFLDPASYTANNAGIVDIQKFKIKSFEDSWSFTFDETEAYNKIKNNELNINLNIDNGSFNIQYNISAVGQHHYVYNDEATGESKLLPAWEQAKNFVQYRLYSQVTNLINGILKNTYTQACSGGEGLSGLHVPGGSNGLLKDLGNSNYLVCNEQITCDVSESEGSYSATYTAIVKRKNDTRWGSSLTKHTITKNISVTNQNNLSNKNITINGTIEGLIEGGLIRSPKPLTFPSSGSIFIYSGGYNGVGYSNAQVVLDKIYTNYGSKKDLKKLFKDDLGITLNELQCNCPDSGQTDDRPDPPHPISFNLTHNYNAGTINYSAEYSNNASCTQRKYHEISIQTSDQASLFATFNVPNSNSGPTIQELNTKTAKTVTITVQGKDLSETGQPSQINLSSFLDCSEATLPISIPVPSDSILTQKQYTSNPIDGTFTVNLAYICGTSGCSI